MTKLLVFCFIFLVIIATLLFGIATMLQNYLTTIRNQLWKIHDDCQAILKNNCYIWDSISSIRSSVACISLAINKDEEESEEEHKKEPDASTDGWTISPCPVCGGPACMGYDRNSGDGYFVICDKHSKHEGCEYGIVAGGKTRRTAAFEWNKAVLVYCNKRAQMAMETGEEEEE